MARNGLLIEYEYCTGCYTCEVVCKQENNLPAGKWGIKLNKIITELPDRVRTDYIPFPTDLCNLCAPRIRNGEQPSCVKYCQAGCMMYGTIAELAKAMEDKLRSVLFAPN